MRNLNTFFEIALESDAFNNATFKNITNIINSYTPYSYVVENDENNLTIKYKNISNCLVVFLTLKNISYY